MKSEHTDAKSFEATPTVEGIRSGFRAIRLTVHMAPFYALLTAAMIYWVKPSYWGLWIGVLLVFELGGYPFILRYLRNQEALRIEEVREERGRLGLTDYPDVGV